MTDLSDSCQELTVEQPNVASPVGEYRPAAPDFRSVFQNHVAYLWHTLRRLGIQEADIEDVSHDVFIQVYRQLDQYDPGRPIRPWLFAFAFRKASEHRRQSRFRLEVLSDPDDPPDVAPTPVNQILRLEELELGHAALGELELGQRAVFVLHDLDGYAMREVASALEIPLNTAYSRLRLARADFAKAVRRLRLRRGDP